MAFSFDTLKSDFIVYDVLSRKLIEYGGFDDIVKLCQNAAGGVKFFTKYGKTFLFLKDEKGEVQCGEIRVFTEHGWDEFNIPERPASEIMANELYSRPLYQSDMDWFLMFMV